MRYLFSLVKDQKIRGTNLGTRRDRSDGVLWIAIEYVVLYGDKYPEISRTLYYQMYLNLTDPTLVKTVE